jgi:hypothetical protein
MGVTICKQSDAWVGCGPTLVTRQPTLPMPNGPCRSRHAHPACCRATCVDCARHEPTWYYMHVIWCELR